MPDTSEAKLFACSQSEELARKIAAHYGQPLGKVEIQRFADGEFRPSFKESLRGKRVFIIGSTFAPTDNLMQMLLMIDAAKRASAQYINAVIPYFGWARQDRKDEPRVPIAAKLVASMLETAGASRVVTMDLHADPIQGFFEIPVDHLYSSTFFIPYIEKLNLDNLVIASPDMGGAKRAHAYAKYLKADVVISYKQRLRANEVSYMQIIGDVKDKNVVLVDDLVDTGRTLVKAANLMMEQGARSVRAVITHPVLSGNAVELIENSPLEELVVTDSIPLKALSNKIKVLTCAPLFAEVMHNIHSHKSISKKFIM
ncbi:MAG: ribose-phosphate pyrophosphokinase [Chlorobi bacterium]|nr:ribose-phosphate pyrophosphokinase [Chlorobiota bacterium]